EPAGGRVARRRRAVALHLEVGPAARRVVPAVDQVDGDGDRPAGDRGEGRGADVHGLPGVAVVRLARGVGDDVGRPVALRRVAQRARSGVRGPGRLALEQQALHLDGDRGAGGLLQVAVRAGQRGGVVELVGPAVRLAEVVPREGVVVGQGAAGRRGEGLVLRAQQVADVGDGDLLVGILVLSTAFSRVQSWARWYDVSTVFVTVRCSSGG